VLFQRATPDCILLTYRVASLPAVAPPESAVTFIFLNDSLDVAMRRRFVHAKDNRPAALVVTGIYH
jgi:hypothetical protein